MSALSSQSSHSNDTQMEGNSLIGYFQMIPNETITEILERSSLTDLSRLSITNKQMRDIIMHHFIESRSGIHKLIPAKYLIRPENGDDESQYYETFESFGLFLKRLTCLLPTAERMRIFMDMISKLDGVPMVVSMAMDVHNGKHIMKCIGRMMHVFVSGWDDTECEYVFHFIERMTHMAQHVTTFVKGTCGAKKALEFYIRSYYRCIMIDPCRNSHIDTSFWLKTILSDESRTEKDRAKLLLIIFGPLVSVASNDADIPHIGWWELTDSFFLHSGMDELGFALHLLNRDNCGVRDNEESEAVIANPKDWEFTEIVSLMNTLITVPEQWLPENVAALLFYCGREITFAFLLPKLEAHSYTELAISIVYLTLVHHTLSNDTAYIVTLIEKLLNSVISSDRSRLIREISVEFADIINDIDNLIEMEDDRDITELNELVRAQSSLMHQLMRKVFHCDCDKQKSSDDEIREPNSEKNKDNDKNNGDNDDDMILVVPEE